MVGKSPGKGLRFEPQSAPERGIGASVGANQLPACISRSDYGENLTPMLTIPLNRLYFSRTDGDR
jgi:hypothetical protein